MRRFAYVLFDLDGTLSESAPGITRCVQYALQSFGIEEPDLQKLESFVGPPLSEEFKRRYGFTDAQCDLAVKKYRERYETTGIFECSLYPGIREMLAAVQGAGLRLAVASSKPEPFVQKVLEHMGIAQYFACVCGAPMEEELQHGGGRDSKELVVERALRELGVLEDAAKKAHTAMVGDRSYDIRGALANGVVPVGVTFGYGTREELVDAGAELLAKDSGELAGILLAEDRPDARKGG